MGNPGLSGSVWISAEPTVLMTLRLAQQALRFAAAENEALSSMNLRGQLYAEQADALAKLSAEIESQLGPGQPDASSVQSSDRPGQTD